MRGYIFVQILMLALSFRLASLAPSPRGLAFFEAKSFRLSADICTISRRDVAPSDEGVANALRLTGGEITSVAVVRLSLRVG